MESRRAAQDSFLFHEVQKEILVDSLTLFVVIKSLDIQLVEGNVITQKWLSWGQIQTHLS